MRGITSINILRALVLAHSGIGVEVLSEDGGLTPANINEKVPPYRG